MRIVTLFVASFLLILCAPREGRADPSRPCPPPGSTSEAALLSASTGAPASSSDREELERRVLGLEGALRDLREQLADPEGKLETVVADARRLKKVTWSGYAQLRYEAPEGGAAGFSVRRARLKVTARPSADVTAVASIDLGGGKQEDKDLYVAWALPRARGWSVTTGQMNLPFGLEVPTSSAVRETPERALWSRQLFAGERDLGVKLSSPSGRPLTAEVGAFNGTGINKPDENDGKVACGRLGWAPLTTVDLGVSGYAGSGKGLRKERVGADVRVYLVDGVSLRGEYVRARELGRRPTGWLAQVNLNLGRARTLTARYDSYDDDGLGQAGTVRTLAVGLTQYLDPTLKVRVFYETPRESGAKVRDDRVRCEAVCVW